VWFALLRLRLKTAPLDRCTTRRAANARVRCARQRVPLPWSGTWTRVSARVRKNSNAKRGNLLILNHAGELKQLNVVCYRQLG
jgi:hypothetical protein